MILSPLHVSPLAFFLRRLVRFQFVSFLQLLGGNQHGFLNTCNPDPRQIGEFQTGDDPVARSRNLQFSVGYNF